MHEIKRLEGNDVLQNIIRILGETEDDRSRSDRDIPSNTAIATRDLEMTDNGCQVCSDMSCNTCQIAAMVQQCSGRA